MEIKSASGGAESALFAKDILSMYENLCNHYSLNLKIIENENSEGVGGKVGLKSGRYEIVGEKAYQIFKFEAGVHKVQRVPMTESKGRVHSSTIQVAIMKSTNSDFKELELDERDLKYEFMRASGKGGQHVNKTDSACRVTHLPTGLMVVNMDSRDQFNNKMNALQVLKQRYNEMMRDKFVNNVNEERKNQTGKGNLSEKIRTYNWPDSRVTDHRIGLTKHGIDKIMEENKMVEIIEELRKCERESKIEQILSVRMEEKI